ncbi:hypothetical protein [Alkalibacterium pelagium]|uniref:Uncharacterized protein n=1 Tax=Alkalibacterium pelagium TaxID=426702 RepID=A0A1H7HAH4_9LACT|nr:hypothetical protein [Alkalibacterium pelagium]GEN51572.1 hypothetical protein APE02nite_22370 [Alkalibacterium pelagium]SEK47443.1 hypothetical protein SAMN04488099_10326 [Alkalibacterium pelagium]
MQNDPTHGNSSPHHASRPTHIEPEQDEKEATSNKSETDELNRNESNKEKESRPEDFEKFNVDKVDDLKKSINSDQKKD